MRRCFKFIFYAAIPIIAFNLIDLYLGKKTSSGESFHSLKVKSSSSNSSFVISYAGEMWKLREAVGVNMF